MQTQHKKNNCTENCINLHFHHSSNVFIYNQFGTKCPRWLVFGFAANQAHFLPKLPNTFPSTLEKLEAIRDEEFGTIGGFWVAYSFVSFIESTYGQEKLLQLFENYSAFEEIMSIPKEKLYKNWLDSIRS